MKFNCPQCNKPYLIADERVRGKILKIRCKNCSTVITVREGMEQAGPPGRRPNRPPSGAAGGQARAASEPGIIDPAELSGRDPRRPETQRLSSVMLEADEDTLPPPDDEWYVSIDGVQEGPFSLERAREWVASRGAEDEIYCWRDTFEDWLPIEDVPELQNARRMSKLALRAPPVGPTPPPNAMKPVPERAASAPDPNLFGEDESMTTIDPRPFAAMGERVPVPNPSSAAEPDDEPVMRLIIADDAASATPAPAPAAAPAPPPAPAPAPAPALPTERPVLARPLSMPGLAAANASSDQSSSAPRAWLSDAQSGPQPALRLPAPYPTLNEAQQPSGLSGEPAPSVRSGRRMILIVGLLLAVVGSGVGAYALVRTFVRPDENGPPPPDDTGDSTLPILRPEDVSAALQRPESQTALKQCYDRARQESPELDIGRLDVDVTVSAAGQVTRVSLSHHGDTSFGTCLIDHIRTWTFDPSRGGVSARVPLIFGS